MREKVIAQSYARALMESGGGDGVAGELTRVTEAINASNELENLLFLEVFTVEEKQSVLDAILDRLGSTKLVKNFFRFLCQEKRLGLFPLIFKAVIVIDDHQRGFIRGDIEGAEAAVDEKIKAQLIQAMEKYLGDTVLLSYRQDLEIAAGYRTKVGDWRLDATVNGQLEQFRNRV